MSPSNPDPAAASGRGGQPKSSPILVEGLEGGSKGWT
jgi:hypothetical protein